MGNPHVLNVFFRKSTHSPPYPGSDIRPAQFPRRHSGNFADSHDESARRKSTIWPNCGAVNSNPPGINGENPLRSNLDISWLQAGHARHMHRRNYRGPRAGILVRMQNALTPMTSQRPALSSIEHLRFPPRASSVINTSPKCNF